MNDNTRAGHPGAPFVVNTGKVGMGGKKAFEARFIWMNLGLFQGEVNHIPKDLCRNPE